jgi:elongation factor P--(R)-beta-lysine ligase
VNTSLESKLSVLFDRSHMLANARSFFKERGVLEVDCPALSQASSIDLHIDVMPVLLNDGKKGYLHTSPEYGMKRLLALGMGDIYQLSHVFRQGEIGPLHNPEFTMVEWYRKELTFFPFIEETLDFIRLFLKDLPASWISYKEAFKKYCGIDYQTADMHALFTLAEENEIHLPPEAKNWDKDTLLQLLLSFLIEPHLGKEELSVLYHFPASQAALSQTLIKDNEPIAERFEVYYKGIELANGYHELTDPIEQRRRLIESNQKRTAQGKEPLPLDENFIEALASGLPDCCGVAVGFDRLMLLKHEKESLQEVLPLPWPVA